MFVKTLFTTAILAAAAVADLPTINGALTDVGTAVDKMIGDLRSWDGQATTAVPILDDSKAIQAVIKDKVAKVQATDAIGLFDAINVLGPTNTLTAKVEEVVSLLISKKPQIDAAALGPVVLQELSDQKNGANDLANAIVAKLPSLAQSIGGPMAQQIVTKLDKAVSAFGNKA